MVIDFHTHIFPDQIASRAVSKLAASSGLKAHTDGSADGLLREMEDGGADLSIILPVVVKPQNYESMADFAQKINARYYKGWPGQEPAGRQLLSFGGLHPRDPEYKAHLRDLADRGFKGIKIHPDYQETFINEPCMLRLIEEAAGLGMIISIHTGFDPGLPPPVHCPPELLQEAVRDIAYDRMVLAHLGGYEYFDRTLELLAGECPCFMDLGATLSGHVPDGLILAFVEKHGADKILFATDSPWSGQKEDIAYMKGLPLAEDDLEKILWKNAAALLGFTGQDQHWS